MQCQVCFRRCIVPKGGRGFCRNKVNVGGRYYTLVYGHPSALQIDPIEKEPHFHMLPGGTIFCTGTASCNNRCKFCQNWHLSQRSLEEIQHVDLHPIQPVANDIYAIRAEHPRLTLVGNIDVDSILQAVADHGAVA